MNQTETILCEGESEVAYIQALGRIMYRPDGSIKRAPFYPRLIGSGYCGVVIGAYKKARSANRKDPIQVLVDKDVYLRNDKNSGTDYQNKSTAIPNFLFSTMNFEDYLMLHCENSILDSWVTICQSKNHFSVPMHSCDYEPLFKQYFPEYEKGSLPFDLTKEVVNRMFSNLRSTPIRNEFGEYLCDLVQSEKLKFY